MKYTTEANRKWQWGGEWETGMDRAVHKWDKPACAYTFVAFKPMGRDQGDEDAMYRSVERFWRLDAWIATALRWITEAENQHGHCKKLYSDTYGMLFTSAMEHLAGNVRMFVEFWEKDKLMGGPSQKLAKGGGLCPMGKSTLGYKVCGLLNM